MNRKKKIIISITGITIIILALLGLTYGYYSTIIKGNTNSNKSLFVTTDRLILEYGEDTSELKTVTNIRPGTTIEMKTFTATNGSNDELEYVAVLENITNTFTRQQDIVYTLTCTSTKGTCNGVESRQFPSTGDLSGMVVNTIPGKATHTYILTVTYLMSSENQNEDQGASFGAKVNIKDPNELNPYNSNKELLAYNIINNAILNNNGTQFRTTPLTIPAQETSEKFNKVTLASSQTTFSITPEVQGYYWTYGTGYKIDSYTGKFTLTGVSTCKYNEGNCASKIKGNYIISTSATSNSSNTNIQKTTTKLSSIYIVDEAPTSDSSSSITMKVKKVSSVRASAESTMSFAQDDWGTSYYYRGDVEDNYLELNNMCFRIVRIQGDGSIKVTLAKEDKCNTIDTTGTTDINSALINNGSTNYVYGYDEVEISWDEEYNEGTYEYYFNYEGYTGTNGLYTNLTNWYNTNLKPVKDKLKYETWCLGGKTSKYEENVYGYVYETRIRLWGPYNSTYNHKTRSATYKCSSEADTVTSYIGLLIADEVVYAGGATYDDNVSDNNKNKSYYLYNNARTPYWLLSRSDFDIGCDNAFVVGSDGQVSSEYITNNRDAVRPAITIASGAEIASGDGTIGNPYTIK